MELNPIVMKLGDCNFTYEFGKKLDWKLEYDFLEKREDSDDEENDTKDIIEYKRKTNGYIEGQLDLKKQTSILNEEITKKEKIIAATIDETEITEKKYLIEKVEVEEVEKALKKLNDIKENLKLFKVGKKNN